MAMVTCEEIAAIVTNPAGRVFLTVGAGRVGGAAFIAAIEWYWYAPRTERSRFFDVWGVEWEGLSWAVVSFPAGRLDAVRRLAKQLGLRLAQGVAAIVEAPPHVKLQASRRYSVELDRGGVHLTFFPGGILPNGRDNLAMFNVENDHHSPVYKNRKRDNDAMLQATGEINGILNRGVRLTPAQVADYIYGPSFPVAD